MNHEKQCSVLVFAALMLIVPLAKADVASDMPEQQASSHVVEKRSRTRKKCRKGNPQCALAEIVRDAASDVFNLNKNLFLWDTFKIVSGVFPAFVGARMIDEKLQACFYDRGSHKNINQMPTWCHTAAKVSIGIPIAFLGMDAFFGKDDDHRWTAQILLLGMPFVIWTKTLIKKMEFDACLRPWNENFSCEKRSSGGFPSGHMAQATYAAVLYGTRYGPAYAVPLGALAAFLGVTFVSCNRHYISQIVGGAGFGAIYALAATKVVQSKLTKEIKLGFKMDDVGRPTLSMAFNF